MVPKAAQASFTEAYEGSRSSRPTDCLQKTKTKKESTPPPIPKAKPANTPASSAKKAKKEKDVMVYRDLSKDTNATIPVNVSFEGTSAAGKLEKSGIYTHTLRLNASAAFILTKTVSLRSRSPLVPR